MSEENDQTTNAVMDWIIFFQRKVLRINSTDIISNIKISTDFSGSFYVNSNLVNLNEVTGFWYRRGHLRLKTSKVLKENFPFINDLNIHLESENKVLGEFVLHSLLAKNSLGNIFNTEVNKLQLLRRAMEYGLKVPETIVTSQKIELEEFHLRNKSIITKCNSEVIMSTMEDVSIISYTKRINFDDISELPTYFSPSLFQAEIEKRYELRVFFLDDKFFPMAIFSQSDAQTAVDFRIYNRAKPNRTVPYLLPKEIEDKLTRLMKDSGYNTGSIDLIVNNQMEYYFLEVNPVGQFDMVSTPCNYSLPKKIAERLCFN